jgi:glucan phosphoethanolaminetransferase (alkaline phosphatase superfamily)
MQMSLLPKTIPGWWSLGLAIFYILFYMFSVWFMGNEQEYSILYAVLITVTGAIISAAAAITGILSVLQKTERAVLVYLSTVIGIYCLVGCIVSLTGKIQ